MGCNCPINVRMGGTPRQCTADNARPRRSMNHRTTTGCTQHRTIHKRIQQTPNTNSSDCGLQCNIHYPFCTWRGCVTHVRVSSQQASSSGLRWPPKSRYYPDKLWKWPIYIRVQLLARFPQCLTFEDRRKQPRMWVEGAVPLGNRTRSFPLAPP